MTASRHSPDQIRQIDAICDRFESALRSGTRPNIEEFLTQVDVELQGAVLKELLPLEIEYRQKHGDTLTASEYRKRFPGSHRCRRHRHQRHAAGDGEAQSGHHG